MRSVTDKILNKIKFNTRRPSIVVLSSLPHALFPFALIIYLSEYQSIELLGRYFLLLSYSGVAQLLLDYGFNSGAIRQISNHDEALDGELSEGIKNLFFRVLLVKLSIGILVIVALMVLSISRIISDLEIQVSIVIGCILSATNVSWLFSGVKKIVGYNLLLIIYKVLFFPFLIFAGESALIYVIVLSAPLLCMFIHGLKLLNFSGISEFAERLRFNFTFSNAKNDINENFGLFINQIIGSGLNIAWPIILASSLGLEKLALLASADRLAKAAIIFYSPLLNIALSKQALLIDVIKYAGSISIIAIALSAIFFVLPSEFIDVLGVHVLTEIKLNVSYYFFIVPISILHYVLFILVISKKLENFYTLIIFTSASTSLVLAITGKVDYAFLIIYELMVCSLTGILLVLKRS